MYKINFLKDNRNDVIRTRGLFVPNEALYQTEPHSAIIFPDIINMPKTLYILIAFCINVNVFKIVDKRCACTVRWK